MLSRRSCLFFLLLVSPAAPASEPEPIHVVVGSAYGDPAAFPQSPGAVVGPKRIPPTTVALPDPEERDALFKQINGLESAIRSFDELDRDLLYLRAGLGDPGRLTAEYPQLPPELLRGLVAALAKGRP